MPYRNRSIPTLACALGLLLLALCTNDYNPFADTATRYRFAFSFVDTGTLAVTINTYRRGGDLSVRTLRVRAVSPLHQDTIRGHYGEPIELATDSVGDDDVLYTWSFGGRDVVQSLYPRLSDTLFGLNVRPRGTAGHCRRLRLCGSPDDCVKHCLMTLVVVLPPIVLTSA